MAETSEFTAPATGEPLDLPDYHSADELGNEIGIAGRTIRVYLKLPQFAGRTLDTIRITKTGPRPTVMLPPDLCSELSAFVAAKKTRNADSGNGDEENENADSSDSVNPGSTIGSVTGRGSGRGPFPRSITPLYDDPLQHPAVAAVLDAKNELIADLRARVVTLETAATASQRSLEAALELAHREQSLQAQAISQQVAQQIAAGATPVLGAAEATPEKKNLAGLGSENDWEMESDKPDGSRRTPMVIKMKAVPFG